MREPGVGVERQRDAGEIDQPRRQQALGDPAPVGEFEQVARRRGVAPIAEAPLAFGIGLDQVEPGLPPRHAQHQVGLDAFGMGQRHDAIRIGIVAQRGGVGHVDPGARQIDRGVESVPPTTLAKAPVAAAGHFHHDLADGDDTGFLIAHG